MMFIYHYHNNNIKYYYNVYYALPVLVTAFTHPPISPKYRVPPNPIAGVDCIPPAVTAAAVTV